jgi:hypothetical protein
MPWLHYLRIEIQFSRKTKMLPAKMLRAGEVVRLKVKHIDSVQKIIRIPFEQKVPHHAGQGHNGEKRYPCPARTVGRGMHGPDDR